MSSMKMFVMKAERIEYFPDFQTYKWRTASFFMDLLGTVSRQEAIQ